MKVKELQDKLAKLDGNADVVVLWKDGSEQHILDLDVVSFQRGVASRRKGQREFAWDPKGPAAYVFIIVSEG
jgi:hypothetical protein